jgi:hypothetical protein
MTPTIVVTYVHEHPEGSECPQNGNEEYDRPPHNGSSFSLGIRRCLYHPDVEMRIVSVETE